MADADPEQRSARTRRGRAVLRSVVVHARQRARARGLLTLWIIAVNAAACSPSPDASPDPSRCRAIAVEYQAAMLTAVACDPAAPGECSTGRPIIVSVQNPDGSLTVEGLCMPPCYAAVSPARTGPVDAILARFYSAGCALGPCWCPPPNSMPPVCLDSGVCSGLSPPP